MVVGAPTHDAVAFNAAAMFVTDATSILDAVLASPPDAYAMALLEGLDPEQLEDEDQVRCAQAWKRIEAHAAARRLDAVRVLAAPTPQEARSEWSDAHRRRVAELEADFGAHEVAIALRIPLRSAQAQVGFARRLATHLPQTRALLDNGTISYQHAVRVVQATETVADPEVARRVEERGLTKAHRQTPGELASSVGRAVADVDPESFARRHGAAVASADVDLRPQPEAMADLFAYGPLTDLATVKQTADAYAARCKAAGDERPLGVLRVEALRVFAELWLREKSPTAHGRPVELHLAVTADMLAGLAETPAVLLGYDEPVPADVARRLLREGAKLRRLLVDPESGHLLDYGRLAYVPPALSAFAGARHPVGAAPGSTTPALRCDDEHATSRRDGGLTDRRNIYPQARSWHNAKTHGRFRVQIEADGTVVWLTPKGQRAAVEPFDYRLGP